MFIGNITLINPIIPQVCVAVLIPVLNILAAELFPTEIRSISVGIVKALNNVASLVNMTIYPIVSGANAFQELMFGYGAVAIFMALWAIITVKETDNMSLMEIEKLYKKDEVNYKTLN